jgi:hypothetical protein
MINAFVFFVCKKEVRSSSDDVFHPNEAGVEVIHSEPETGGKYRFSATGSGGGVFFLQEKMTSVRIKMRGRWLILFIITNFFILA